MYFNGNYVVSSHQLNKFEKSIFGNLKGNLCFKGPCNVMLNAQN